MVTILFSDWVGGKLLYIQPDGNFKSLVTLTQGAADHEVIHDKNLLILAYDEHR